MRRFYQILPRYIGCYISGNGLNDAPIKAEVYEKRTLISIPTGSHYYRSMQCMLMIVEVTDTISWEVFFLANDTQLNDDLIQLQMLMGEKNAEVARITFPQVLSIIPPLPIKYNTFLIECQVKSEMAVFNVNMKKMFNLFKYITTSDREGW